MTAQELADARKVIQSTDIRKVREEIEKALLSAGSKRTDICNFNFSNLTSRQQDILLTELRRDGYECTFITNPDPGHYANHDYLLVKIPE